MRLSPAVLLFLLLCGSLPSSSIQSKCDVKCHTPKTCIMNTTGDIHSIECKAKLGMRLDYDDYYTAGKKWMCNDREYGAYWTDMDLDPPKATKAVAWRTIQTVECVEKLPCHLVSPLVSSCRGSIVCTEVVSADSERIECNKDSIDELELIMQRVPYVDCNDQTGQWWSKNHSGPFPLPKGSNVRCLRQFEHEERDKNGNKMLEMEEELNAKYNEIVVREYYQTGALLCVVSCILSVVFAYSMYCCCYEPRMKAYTHEWSGKQIHGGWREYYGRPRPRRRPWRIVKWIKYVLGRDGKPRPTLQNVYDDVSTCVSLTEESDFSDCEDCDNCKLCPDWMDCNSLDDLADKCSTCSGRDACCSISTCSCTGPQAETTALSWSGGNSETDDDVIDEEHVEGKCNCKKMARCDDKTCCILGRIPKRRPMKGYRKKAKVAAKAERKLKETKEWQDFYSSTNARLMGINNETRLQQMKSKAELEAERKEREKEKEREANPELEKEEEAKRIRNKERVRLKVHEDFFDSSLAVDKVLQIMQRYRDGYDGFEDNDDLEEDETQRKAACKEAEAEAVVKEVKRKAAAAEKKEDKEEDKEYQEWLEEKRKKWEKQGKSKSEKKVKKEMKEMTREDYEKEKAERIKQAKMGGEDEGPPRAIKDRDAPMIRKHSLKGRIPSRVSKAETKPVTMTYKDRKPGIIRHAMMSIEVKDEPLANYAEVATGMAVNLKNAKRLTRAETKRM